MSYRLRIELVYKDKTVRGLKIECPERVAKELMSKGLLATRVFIDTNMVITNPGLAKKNLLEIESFKKENLS